MGQPTSIGRGAHRVWHVNPGPKKKKKKPCTILCKLIRLRVPGSRSMKRPVSNYTFIFFLRKKFFPPPKREIQNISHPCSNQYEDWINFFWLNPPRAPAAHFHRPRRSPC